MSVRLQIAILVHMMVQAVTFGIGALLVLATPLSQMAMTLMPWVVGLSLVVGAPISWWIAPRLRARFWRENGMPNGDLISGPARP